MCDWTVATKKLGDDRVAHLYMDEDPLYDYENWTPNPNEDAAYVLSTYTLVDGRRFADPDDSVGSIWQTLNDTSEQLEAHLDNLLVGMIPPQNERYIAANHWEFK